MASGGMFGGHMKAAAQDKAMLLQRGSISA
jgi:hypothetical protein